ncbi:MAG TPA: pilus assembly protein PilW [Sedimenticola thiotaurini]|uniref:Pilus assembly protein PilW n=1 Tax=Sedimenticola thiotaurini TaxID=1543721 RepID=A0A831RJP5_9GAMM|nr:pilus assembly protein PilW [Sedimenticola thiotaurini]
MSRAIQRVRSRRGSRGVTMVELLIAMVLALLLSVAIVQLFVSNRQTFNIQEGIARLQENGRFAMEFITRELRDAGYSGCIQDGTQINNVLNKTLASGGLSPMWDFSRTVLGFEGGTSGWTPTPGSGTYADFDFPSAINGTDIITIHTSELLPLKAFQAGNLTAAAVGEAAITTNQATGLNQNDILFVTDCDKGAIFQVTNANPGTTIAHEVTTKTTSGAVTRYPGNAIKALGHVYGQNNGASPAGPAEISRLRAVSFFIRNDTNGRPALWRRIYNEAPEELVKGVEDMQILYGIATDVNQWGTVSYYVSADQVAAGDWNKVASVRIHLLLQSDDNMAKNPIPYTFNGTTTTPTDRRVRREFVTTVGIRNQIL